MYVYYYPIPRFVNNHIYLNEMGWILQNKAGLVLGHSMKNQSVVPT